LLWLSAGGLLHHLLLLAQIVIVAFLFKPLEIIDRLLHLGGLFLEQTIVIFLVLIKFWSRGFLLLIFVV